MLNKSSFSGVRKLVQYLQFLSDIFIYLIVSQILLWHFCLVEANVRFELFFGILPLPRQHCTGNIG